MVFSRRRCIPVIESLCITEAMCLRKLRVVSSMLQSLPYDERQIVVAMETSFDSPSGKIRTSNSKKRFDRLAHRSRAQNTAMAMHPHYQAECHRCDGRERKFAAAEPNLAITMMAYAYLA